MDDVGVGGEVTIKADGVGDGRTSRIFTYHLRIIGEPIHIF